MVKTRMRQGRPRVITDAKIRAIIAAVDDLEAAEDFETVIPAKTRLVLEEAKEAASDLRSDLFEGAST